MKQRMQLDRNKNNISSDNLSDELSPDLADYP